MNRRRPSWCRPFAFAAALALAANLVAGSPAAMPAVASAAAPTPVAEWTFDEGSGSTASDSVGGLDGAITGGATWTAGANGSPHALQFNGTDALVTVANNATLEPSNFSLSLWVRGGPTTETGAHTILQKGDYGCDFGASYRFYESYHPNLAGSQVSADVGQTAYGSVYPASFPIINPKWDETWHHLVLVVNDDTTTGWIDGYSRTASLNSGDTVRYGAAGRLDDALHFGGPGADCPSWKPFDGAIDDVQLYSTALTDSQVLAMMPVSSTTTTMGVFENACCGTPLHSVYSDHDVGFVSETTPAPGADGLVTWHLSKDGAADEIVGTSTLVWNGSTVPAARSAVFSWPVGTLSPGSYVAKAVWEGTPNWSASSSAEYAFTVIRHPVTVIMTATPNNNLPGGGSTLRARVSSPGLSAVVGAVEFHDVTGGGDVLLGSANLANYGPPIGSQAGFDVTGLVAGTHLYVARFAETDALESGAGTTSVTVGPQRANPYLEVAPNPVLSTAAATATVTLGTSWKDTNAGALPTATGTVTLKRVSTGAVIGAAPVSGPGPYTFQLPIYPIGTIGLVAEYSGDANFDPSTGNQVDLVVQADVVDATGVTLGATTFYPVVDGYRDTVAIKGVRNEPASVTIRIFNSTNHVVRVLSIAKGTGPYSINWNGKGTSGTLQPAGTYRVVQTLTDAHNIHLVVSKSVALSRKKLYFTTKTLTKYADAASSVGYSGAGYALKYSDHSIRLRAAGGWVGVGWQFTLPTATTYKSLSVGLYGSSAIPIGHFGAQNFSWCAFTSTWYEGCFDHMTGMRSTTGWSSRAVSPTYNRYGHAVRLSYSQYSGASHIYKVRLIVTYGILK